MFHKNFDLKIQSLHKHRFSHRTSALCIVLSNILEKWEMNSFSFFIKFLSCFLLLTCKITFIRGNLHADVNNTVEEIIHAASGVYLDRDISRQSGLEKTIVVTSS